MYNWIYNTVYRKYYPFRCPAEVYVLPSKRERNMLFHLIRAYSRCMDKKNFKSTYQAFSHDYIASRDADLDTYSAIILADKVRKNEVLELTDSELGYINDAMYRYRYRFSNTFVKLIKRYFP